MASGDAAKSVGYTLVQGTDKVRNGPTAFNDTRDMVANVKKSIPVGKGGYRSASGISSGTATPSNTTGSDGDIYFKIV